jgi:bifunctional DNA-binding transcriptional regulator/antitoxin component of YhaV-PrlF toxin-antitoxin module
MEKAMSKTLMTPEGEIILPREIREKYGYNDWMLLSVVDMGDGSILIKPYETELTKVFDGVTLEDMIVTLREERKKLFQEKYGKLK